MDTNVTTSYDEELREQLEEHAIATIKLTGSCVVQGCEDASRYNAALLFAMTYGFDYSYDVQAGTFTLTMPTEDGWQAATGIQNVQPPAPM